MTPGVLVRLLDIPVLLVHITRDGIVIEPPSSRMIRGVVGPGAARGSPPTPALRRS